MSQTSPTGRDPQTASDPTDLAPPVPDRPDPRLRPADPAGTRPKVDPDSLLPARRSGPGVDVYDSTASEESDLLPSTSRAAGPPSRGLALTDEPVPHAGRFQFLLGALIAFAVAAIAAAVLLKGGGSSSSSGPQWSAWHPSTSAGSAAQQIGDHVGSEYRLPGGQQLVLVTGGPLQVAGLPITVALRSDPNNSGGISLLNGKGALYRLCGLGAKCSIDQGKPSLTRSLLLDREALELALYSFRYIDGVKQVVVLMPPKPGADPNVALFFRPGDVQGELKRPLPTTLVSPTPTVTGVQHSPDFPAVARLTQPSIYQFSLTQSTADNSVYLVLRPFTLPTQSSAPHKP